MPHPEQMAFFSDHFGILNLFTLTLFPYTIRSEGTMSFPGLATLKHKIFNIFVIAQIFMV